MEVVNAIGRRKSAVARIYMKEGKGKITINDRELAELFSASAVTVYCSATLEPGRSYR